MAIIGSKLLWLRNIAENQALVLFSGKIDFIEAVNIVLGKTAAVRSNYRYTVVENFVSSFFQPLFNIGNTNIGISYTVLFVGLLSLLALFVKAYSASENNDKKAKKIFLLVVIAMMLFFSVGLCLSYMYKFSEYEGVRVASFSRYINICAAMIIMILVAGTASLSNAVEPADSGSGQCILTKRWLSLALALLIIATPFNSVYGLISRNDTYKSQSDREPYDEFKSRALSLIGNDDVVDINLICQESTGYEYFVLRYCMRPHRISGSWSIGIPFEGDDCGYTAQITCQEWMSNLKSNYDYVILWNFDKNFIEEFSSAFEDTNEIGRQRLYSVDKATGMLTYVE